MIRRILFAGLGGFAGFLFWFFVLSPRWAQEGRSGDGVAGNKQAEGQIIGMVLSVLGCGAIVMVVGEKLGLIPSQEQVDQKAKPVSLFGGPNPVNEPAPEVALSGCQTFALSEDEIVRRSELLRKAGHRPKLFFFGANAEGVLTTAGSPQTGPALPLFTTPYAARDYIRTFKRDMEVHEIAVENLVAQSQKWSEVGVKHFILNPCPRCDSWLLCSASVLPDSEKFLKIWAIEQAARWCRGEIGVLQMQAHLLNSATAEARTAVENIRDHIDCGIPYVHQMVAVLSAGLNDGDAELAACERLKEFGPEFEWSPADRDDGDKIAKMTAGAMVGLMKIFEPPPSSPV